MKCCRADEPVIVKRLIKCRNVLLCIANNYTERARFGFSGQFEGIYIFMDYNIIYRVVE